MISGEVKGDILVVDDDLPALQLLSQLLAGHGYEVRSARDGSTALMIATADPPDLILLDIQMPGMDGYQVCEQLKLNPASRDIPVLFISAKDAVLDKIRGFEAGAVDYINKPYHTEEILARIKTHLTISRLHTKLTATNTLLQEEVQMREQAQLALQASEASLRAQYQGIPIPTTTWKRSGADFILVDYNQALVLNARSDVTNLLGVSARELFADQRNIVADMTACISAEKSIEREIDYTFRSSGETRTMAVKYAFVPPDLVLAHFEDVTERKQAEHQLMQRLNELSSLHQIAKTIAAKRELTQALELVCETINNLFDTQLTLIALLADEITQQRGLIGVDRSGGVISLPSAELTKSAISLLQSQPGQGKSRAIADLQTLPLPEPLDDYARVNHLSTCLIIPMISRGTAQGCLILAQSGGRSFFDEKKIELAETIATDIASAVENEHLTEQARAAAVGAERQRLARELHDSVTQSIYSLTLLSSGWESMARQGTLEDPADSFHRLGAVGQQALREMRLLIHQLRPSNLEELGLANALQQRLDTVERRSNIDAQLTIQGDLAGLPPQIEDELFNIAQEALNNSLRHAMARSVRVLVKEDQGKVALSVEDDGVGFNDSAKHFGMGLRNMQERAGFIGGEFSIQSLAEHGTRVTITVDLGKKK